MQCLSTSHCPPPNSDSVGRVYQVCSVRPAPLSAIWVDVPASLGHIISLLCQPFPDGPGLHYHHASGLSASLVRWLQEGTCRIPDYATHQLGVSGKPFCCCDLLIHLQMILCKQLQNDKRYAPRLSNLPIFVKFYDGLCSSAGSRAS